MKQTQYLYTNIWKGASNPCLNVFFKLFYSEQAEPNYTNEKKKRQSDGEQTVPDLTADTVSYETRMNIGSRWNIWSLTAVKSHCTEEF